MRHPAAPAARSSCLALPLPLSWLLIVTLSLTNLLAWGLLLRYKHMDPLDGMEPSSAWDGSLPMSTQPMAPLDPRHSRMGLGRMGLTQFTLSPRGSASTFPPHSQGPAAAAWTEDMHAAGAGPHAGDPDSAHAAGAPSPSVPRPENATTSDPAAPLLGAGKQQMRIHADFHEKTSRRRAQRRPEMQQQRIQQQLQQLGIGAQQQQLLKQLGVGGQQQLLEKLQQQHKRQGGHMHSTLKGAAATASSVSPPGQQQLFSRTTPAVGDVAEDQSLARPGNGSAAGQQHGADWPPVWWFAPFFDRTSFGHEAATLLLGAVRSGAVNESSLWLGTTQGDCQYEEDNSMPREDFAQLDAAVKRADPGQPAIVVCHSLPPFWARPRHRWPSCAPCPPLGYTSALAVGRAMAETDIYNEEFVRQCNRMDEVWVPSRFSMDVLKTSGVDPSKLHIVPIAVNTTMFDPAVTRPLPLPIGDLVFGTPRRFSMNGPPPTPTPGRLAALAERASRRSAATSHLMDHRLATAGPSGMSSLLKRLEAFQDKQHLSLGDALEGRQVQPGSSSAAEGTAGAGGSAAQRETQELQQLLELRERRGESKLVGLLLARGRSPPSTRGPEQETLRGTVEAEEVAAPRRPFVFVSTFKWEMRKGWDVLLAAYLQEFSAADDVELYILTKPFAQSGSNFMQVMHSWAAEHLNMSDAGLQAAPSLYVISGHVTTEDYTGLYRSAHCYVSPTRGEGWGMPITEAMSMGLPSIVTNWSGTADFVDESVGYPLKYRLSAVPEDQLWWFKGARWADADVGHLRQMMRHVYENQAEAGRKGAASRRLMHETYSPAAVGAKLAVELRRVRASIRSGNCSACFNKEFVATQEMVDLGMDPYPAPSSKEIDASDELIRLEALQTLLNYSKSVSFQL